jgi:hypothetical protein
MNVHAALLTLLFVALLACKAQHDDDPEPGQSGGSGGTAGTRDDGSQRPGGSGGHGGNHSGGSGGTSASAGGNGGSTDQGLPNAGKDAGAAGAGGSEPDAGEMKDAGPAPDPDAAVGDGGVTDLGSCCVAHDTPGCSNADLQVCVCEKLSSCCTEKWGAACVLIVEQKYCQTGVRDCVCGSGADQWMQTACCDSSWTNFCDEVAESKCDAVRGCF